MAKGFQTGIGWVADINLLYKSKSYFSGFAIYQLDDPEANLPLDTDFFKYHASCARSKTFINLREVVNRFKLHPGTYVIIPSTFQQNQEGDFLIRVFSEKGSGLEAVWILNHCFCYLPKC